MKIIKTLLMSFNAGKTINPVKLANAKAGLATMSQTDLLAIMHREARKTGDLAAKLGLRKSVPTVVQALAELHREAVYMRNGQRAPQTVFVDVWRNAFAYVNKRNQLAKPLSFDTLKDAPKVSVDISSWRLGVEKERDVETAIQYGQARIERTFVMMDDWRKEHGSRPMVWGGAKMSNLQYHIEAQKMLGETFVNEWAGMAKDQSGKKVTFARTNSSESIERGGLAFDGESPVSVSGLVSKLAKVEGKKPDR